MRRIQGLLDFIQSHETIMMCYEIIMRGLRYLIVFHDISFKCIMIYQDQFEICYQNKILMYSIFK